MVLAVGKVLHLRSRPGGGDLGVDRLSLSFPLAAFDPSALPDGKMREGVVTAQRAQVTSQDDRYDGLSVMVGASQVAGQWWGKVECNPSRMADPGGCSLLPLRETPVAVEAMADVVWSLGMVPAEDVEDWRVKRLDVARDFAGVVAPPFYIRGLANVKRPYAKRHGLWSDAGCGSAQTLHVGSGAGMVRLYDQHEAYAKKGADPGDVRWEVELRDGWLERHGVARCADLGVAKMEDAAAERWSWSRMGERVTGTVNVVEAIDRIVKAGGYAERGEWVKVSPAVADRLLAQLLRESLGTSWKASNDSAARYERFKRHLGVVPSAELFKGADVSVSGYLDFDQGVEVAA